MGSKVSKGQPCSHHDIVQDEEEESPAAQEKKAKEIAKHMGAGVDYV